MESGVKYLTLTDCVNSCYLSEPERTIDPPMTSWINKPEGPCRNCTTQIRTTQPFGHILSAIGTPKGGLFDKNDPSGKLLSTCNWKATFEIFIPPEWDYPYGDFGPGNTSFLCSGRIGNLRAGQCQIHQQDTSKGLTVILDCSLENLFELYNSGGTGIVIEFRGLQSPPDPSTSEFDTANDPILHFRFIQCGNLQDVFVPNRQEVAFDLMLNNTIEIQAGSFANISTAIHRPENLTAGVSSDYLLGTGQEIDFVFVTGSVLYANSSLVLQDQEQEDGEQNRLLLDMARDRQISAKMVFPFEIPYLNVIVSSTNITLVLPSDLDDKICDIGETVAIRLSTLRLPDAVEDFPWMFTLSAFSKEQKLIAQEASGIFLKDLSFERSKSPAQLDIFTTAIFGFCSLFALSIIYQHGLHFTAQTFWTDMVAMSAFFTLIAATCAYLMWMCWPSKAFVFLYLTQYFWNAIMVLAICFHWASVLLLKLFHSFSFKSRISLVFMTVSLSLLALLVVIYFVYDDTPGFNCVYAHDDVRTCRDNKNSASDCQRGHPPVNGSLMRNIIKECGVDGFFTILSTVFIVSTFFLMVFGCRVLYRGRVLLSHGTTYHSLEPQIRHSLMIFYAIIATIILLYSSSGIVSVFHFTSDADAKDSSAISDEVWYVFIVWLPQCLPPMLLLFLQWNPSSSSSADSSFKDNKYSDDENNAGQADGSDDDDEDDDDDLEPGTPAFANYTRAINNSGRSTSRSFLEEQQYHGHTGLKMRLMVELKLPSDSRIFSTRTTNTTHEAEEGCPCFLSLEHCTLPAPLESNQSLRDLSSPDKWSPSGKTEQISVSSASSASKISFVAVLQAPIAGFTSNILFRFVVHAGATATSSQPMYEFVTTPKAIMEATSNGQAMVVPNATDDHTLVTLQDQVQQQQQQHEEARARARAGTGAELYIQTVMIPSTATSALVNVGKNQKHQQIGNISRFFQYDTEGQRDAGGLVLQELKESHYANLIPRQFLEIILVERQTQARNFRSERSKFRSANRKRLGSKGATTSGTAAGLNFGQGFYATLIGQIQDEGDAHVIRDWLEARATKAKEYNVLLRQSIHLLLCRDRERQYFKASTEKKNPHLRFCPINIHVEDLVVGPKHMFGGQSQAPVSSTRDISVYETTTVGAMAAHVYKFKLGGILSLQTRLEKLELEASEETTLEQQQQRASGSSSQPRLSASGDGTTHSLWNERRRKIEDLKWQIQQRMDVCFSQALAALVASFSRKLELALTNPEPHVGMEILRNLSTLGFLYQVESLLSTQGKEMGMLEDMAAAIAELSKVSFVVVDVKDKPLSRFSFIGLHHQATSSSLASSGPGSSASSAFGGPKPGSGGIEKVQLSYRAPTQQFIVTFKITSGPNLTLPEKLQSGGEIPVIPVLFTQGINEMQSIVNQTDRSKTELQDLINLNNLRPLKVYCDKYSRLALAMPPMQPHDYRNGLHHLYRGNAQQQQQQQQPRPKPRHHHSLEFSEQDVAREYSTLELMIINASHQTGARSKHPEILQKASDLCRALGAGRVTVCKSAKDRTAMSVTLEHGRILHKHHNLPQCRIKSTVAVMRTHGARIENAFKNTGKRQFAFNKLQRSLLPEDYRCPDEVSGSGNVS